MPRFKKILVVASATADASSALIRAIRLARPGRSQIKVYDVLEPLPVGEKKIFKSVGRRKLQRMLLRKRLEELQAIVAHTDTTGVKVRVEVVIGTRFIEIIREVIRNGHDLVMKPVANDERSHLPGFGSTDLHLMRECPCAVWIVKPAHSEKYDRVLAAVDPDPSDRAGNLLNESVMEVALAISELENSELHVGHAWTLYNEGLLNVLVGNLDKLVAATRKTHRRWLNSLLQKFSIPKDRSRVHLVRGPAKEAIPELARKVRVELIVIGTAARSGIPHFLIGNTAEDVLNQVDCSVVTVKTKDFVSPITLGKG